MKKSRRSTAIRKAARPVRKKIQRRDREGVKSKSRRRASRRPAKTPVTDLKSRYLDAYRKELTTTLKVLKAFPSGKDDFRPHERSQTVTRLAHTFAVENTGATRAARGEPLDPAALPAPPATYAEAVGAYERGAADLIAAVQEMPDSRLSEEIPFLTGPRQMGNMSVLDVLWFLLMDSIHHRGQLSVYLRLAGGKVPSIYGPSADEPWR